MSRWHWRENWTGVNVFVKAYDSEIDGFSFTKGKGRKSREPKQPLVRYSTAGVDSLATVEGHSKPAGSIDHHQDTQPKATATQVPCEPPVSIPADTPAPIGFSGLFFRFVSSCITSDWALRSHFPPFSSTFFGGNTPDYATPTDQYAWFKDFSVVINY